MKRFLTMLALVFSASMLFGQGVTTGSIYGQITDEKGEELIGANIVAVHVPSGTSYGNSSDLSGYFTVPNMRVGGPYKVTISYTGFEDFVKDIPKINLGQKFKLNVQMSESAYNLGEIAVVSKRNDVFDGNITGAQTVVGEEQIAALPTVARAIGDFARMTPQASVTEGNDGFTISLNGMNNRYNAIYIDGAVNNDVFGLAGSGTNGGQTGVSPFSIDAIEEFQISLAPFDVRQGGFAGGSINAITRSGDNNLEGSAYYFFRNENTAGQTPTDNPLVERRQLEEFNARTFGFRLGGPIIKDKLFFFVNAELQRDETPLPFDFINYQGDATQEQIGQLEDKLNGYGYDPGGYLNNSSFLDSDKITAKIDWNANPTNTISLKHSYVGAKNQEPFQSTTRNIRFQNGAEYFESTTNNTSLEWNSIIGSTMSNNLKIGYTKVNDDRDPTGQPFPYVDITDGPANIFFGSEQFSTANLLEQDIFTLTNNFEIYKGRHTITIGTHNEFYSAKNLFIAFNYGSYEFNSLEDFLTDQNSSFFIRNYSLRDNIVGDDSAAAAEFTSAQFGLYVQDEIQVSNNFRLTLGLRADMPTFEDTPVNEDFNANTLPLIEEQGYDLRGAETGKFIDNQILLSPRLGFNWDLTGEQKTQLRGGIGVFTSRVPQVWPGGAFNNFGLNVGTALAFGDLPFNPDINTQLPGEIDPANPSPSGSIDLFASDFKVPQVWKANLAFDQKLSGGLLLNIDGIFNKTINNVAYQNLNLRPSVGNLTGTPDDRPIYDRRDEIDGTYDRILLGYNTDKGYTYNATVSLTKPIDDKGFAGMVAYSYGDSYSIFDGTSSQNSSQWRGLHSIGGRNFDQPLSRSDFSQGHRVILQLSKKFYWSTEKNIATTFSIFHESRQGTPYSYIYNDRGNLTSEDSRERALVFVPATIDDIVLVNDGDRTAGEQWSELDAFIDSDDYLSGRRGKYAERNESRAPWSHVMDLKILQDFYLNMGGKRHTFQFTFDIFNFTNMLNRDWGRRYFVGSFGNFELLNFEGFQTDPNTGENTVPTFTFDGVEDNNPAKDNIDDNGISSSRYQIQVGLRYIFK